MALRRDNPLNAPLAEGVQRIGFRKWYERELLSSHAHMVLAILAVIGLLGSLEAMRGATAAEKVMDLGFAAVSGGLAFWALRRYLYLLMRAEAIANQANCDTCGEYGRFRVVAHDARSNETTVTCLKCTHRWTIAGHR